MYNNANSTMTLSMVGTLEYVPPEARDDHRDKIPTGHYTASFDIFSAGVIAHELLTGLLHEGLSQVSFMKFMLHVPLIFFQML